MAHLNEAHTALGQAPGKQHLAAELVGFRLVDAVHLPHVLRLALEVDQAMQQLADRYQTGCRCTTGDFQIRGGE